MTPPLEDEAVIRALIDHWAAAVRRRENDGSTTPLDFRFTVGLRKIDGAWIIEHEHHSLPAES